MPASVFKCADYKTFLKQQIAANDHVRGYQSRLAQAARCQRSYLSQVLNAGRDLSPEQGIRLSVFWNFNQAETAYFIDLIELARTEHPALQKIIRRRLSDLKAKQENIAERVSQDTQLEPLQTENQAIYYSSWHYAALHILAGIKTYQTPAAMATRLGLSPQVVDEALAKLMHLGLVERVGPSWRIATLNLHVDRNSPWCNLNHANWRQRASLNCQSGLTDSLHYTAIHSHGLKEFDELKNILLETIDRTRSVIAPSPDEELTCLCLDFFRV